MTSKNHFWPEMANHLPASKLESRRRRVARIVSKLASQATNPVTLISDVKEAFGFECQYIGQGLARIAYTLPYNLVLKLAFSRYRPNPKKQDPCPVQDQNKIEAEMSKRHPDDCPIVYTWVRHDWTEGSFENSTGINVLVVERVNPLFDHSLKEEFGADELRFQWAVILSENPTLRALVDRWNDSHLFNVGQRHTGEFVILDSGLGAIGEEPRHWYQTDYANA